MKIYVGGVNASGKTTLLKNVSELTRYPVLHGASLLMEYLGCPNDYDRLRQFTDSEKDIAMCAVNTEIAKRKENCLLDSHYLMLIKGEISALPLEWFRGFDLFVLISTPTDVLWSRISADEGSRDRQLFREGSKEEERKQLLESFGLRTEHEFDRVRNVYGVPGLHIRNNGKDVNSATQEIVNHIHQLNSHVAPR